jgi:hypothetical protein
MSELGYPAWRSSKRWASRATTESAASLIAIATTRQVPEELRKTGRFDALAPAITQADAQRLFIRS